MLVGGACGSAGGTRGRPCWRCSAYCTLLAASPFPLSTRNFIRGTLYAIPAALLCKFLLLPLINGFPLLLLCLAFFWSFRYPGHHSAQAGVAGNRLPDRLQHPGRHRQSRPLRFRRLRQPVLRLGAGALHQPAGLPPAAEGHGTAFGVAARPSAPRDPRLAASSRRFRRACLAGPPAASHRPAGRAAWHGTSAQRAGPAPGLRIPATRPRVARLWRALAGLDPAAAEARWIERALRAIAVRHRDPPLAARHARRAGARLAAAGEWRLAAILTDLAWLLRAYSQSVSSDGAQHGEKTS